MGSHCGGRVVSRKRHRRRRSISPSEMLFYAIRTYVKKLLIKRIDTKKEWCYYNEKGVADDGSPDHLEVYRKIIA